MKSYNEFATVPESGIMSVKEGTTLRVYFDIKPHEAPESENAPEDMQEASYENQYECEVVDVEGQTYADIVSAIVNEKYSADDVQALQANYIEAKDPESELADEKRAEYLEEYADFQTWRKKAKEIAAYVVDNLAQ